MVVEVSGNTVSRETPPLVACKPMASIKVQSRRQPKYMSMQEWIKKMRYIYTMENSVTQFSCSVMSNYLQPHGLQDTRPPCPSPTPGVHTNSCPLSQSCHPTISSCCPLLLLPSIFPSIRVFSNESVRHIRWPKYWSFSFSIRTDFL